MKWQLLMIAAVLVASTLTVDARSLLAERAAAAGKGAVLRKAANTFQAKKQALSEEDFGLLKMKALDKFKRSRVNGQVKRALAQKVKGRVAARRNAHQVEVEDVEIQAEE